MITYPMNIPLFPLQPEKIGLLLSNDKGDSIWDQLSWRYRYGTEDFIQGRKAEEAQPPPIYDPMLGQIEAAVNDEP